MRGADVTQEGLFVTRKTADYVPEGHPLRAIREILNRALRDMDLLFESIYDERGRYSVPPEWLLRGLVLQALYGIRSERLLCEQFGYNLLYRWFVGLSMDDAAWDHSTYTKNRDRLIAHDVVRALFGRVMQQAKEARLLSDEHFSVDGTMIRAWASHKSFVPKDGPPPPSSGSRSNPEVDFKGKRRSNDTHASTTDPDAKMYAKSNKQESLPAYLGHVLMENRSKLAVDTRLTQATGTAEIEAALQMLETCPEPNPRRWAPIRTSTPPNSSLPAASSRSPRMWRRTATSTTPGPANVPAATAASMGVRPGMLGTRSVRSFVR